MVKPRVFLWVLLFVSSFCVAKNTNVVTVLSAENALDSRHFYERDLIRLALSKTEDDYGKAHVISAPAMSMLRGIESMRIDRFPNFVRSFAYNPKLSKDEGFTHIKFPIHRGVASYRTCFSSESNLAKTENVESIEELQRFSFGMGAGWTDSEIFRHNGFSKITEVGNYNNLFKMTALGRVDFFCRGANEVFHEFKKNKHIKNLALDKSFAIYYPIPLLLYANNVNKPILKRIELGIERAIADGSFDALWNEHYEQSIAFSELDKRKIFYLKSPIVNSIGFDYEQYFFLPPPVNTIAAE